MTPREALARAVAETRFLNFDVLSTKDRECYLIDAGICLELLAKHGFRLVGRESVVLTREDAQRACDVFHDTRDSLTPEEAAVWHKIRDAVERGAGR